MTALEKVLLLVSFRKCGELSKDDKHKILEGRTCNLEEAEHHTVLM